MKITPVIEFGPELFRKETRDYPSFELEGDSYRKAREEFWYAMLADWGIIDINPFAKGSEFVALSDISDQTLDILIDRELAISEVTEKINPDEVSSLCGGIIFESGSHIIEPSCCGALSDFIEWEDLARSPVGKVKQVWIGHPWIDVAGVDNDKMKLSMHREQSSELVFEFIISQAELLPQIEKAGHELNAFNDRVKSELRRKSYPIELASALTGVENKKAK